MAYLGQQSSPKGWPKLPAPRPAQSHTPLHVLALLCILTTVRCIQCIPCAPWPSLHVPTHAATVCTSQPLIAHADALPMPSATVHPPSTCHPTHCGIPCAHGPPYASQPALPRYVPHSPCSPTLTHRPRRPRRSAHSLCATATTLSVPPPLPSPCCRRRPLRAATSPSRSTQPHHMS